MLFVNCEIRPLLRSLKSQSNTRHLWQWINIIFNKVDEERRKLVGPDRTCAEWILRNGGQVKWLGNPEYLADYNQLPPEGTKLHIQEVDATGSSIMHYGFPHFEGCKHIEKIIFHDCGYLYDQALDMMKPIDKTLTNLQVSKCGNITEEGLLYLGGLNGLKILLMYDLPYVKDKEKILTALKQKLPNCKVEYK
ncbi:hypothetical protein Trydic_g4040 [Trypoxylus dichotomus]